MARKPPPDWDAIEKLYRTGGLSNRQIADKYGCTEGAIRKRAKHDSWVRDLKGRVNAQTDRKLLEAEMPDATGFGTQTVRTKRTSEAEEQALVENAAVVRSDIVKQHRAVIGKAQSITLRMLERLEGLAEYQDEIEDDIEAETEGDKDGKRRHRMMSAVSLGAQATIIKDLSGALRTLTTAERQAYGLSDKVPDTPPPTDNDDKSREMLRAVHDALTNGALARPGGQLKVIDVVPNPVQQPQPSGQRARR